MTSSELYAYFDESGNTGYRIDDTTQPTFYECAVISSFDLNMGELCELDDIKNKLGLNRLHAAEIGMEKIESFIPIISQLALRHNLTFFISKIDKFHFAKLKLFDLIFDNGSVVSG